MDGFKEKAVDVHCVPVDNTFSQCGIGTKSQQALKLQQEQNKQERKEKSRKRKEAEEQRMFELKQRKKLEENAKK